jgi:hypothetical protein
MSRRQYGTRFTTGCGHSWRWRYPKWTVGVMRGATTDCPYVVDKATGEQCEALLIIPSEQFEGMHLDRYPAEVHMPLFHKYLHQQDESWPEDGAGTGYVEFGLDGDEYVMRGKDAG